MSRRENTVRFKRVYIELTNQCNLRCGFCPRTQRQPAQMSAEMFRFVLTQIKGYTEHLYFHVMGEPLLHPELGRFLDDCRQEGFRVNLTTNGTRIGAVKDRLIGKPSLRQVNFSLHSFDGNAQAASRTADQESYIRDILSFARQARERADVLISLRLWNFYPNPSETNRKTLELIEREFSPDKPLCLPEAAERGVRLADGVYLNPGYEFAWPDIEGKEEERFGFCYGLREQIAVLADGTVVPCCLDKDGNIPLGNLCRTAFSDIISGERASAILAGFARGEAVETLCRKCTYRRRFTKHLPNRGSHVEKRDP